MKQIEKFFIIGCGSAFHAGMAGKYTIESLARIPVEVDLASEFRYRNPILDKHTLVIVISQSGETADTLAALREAKHQGILTLAIVNTVGSSIAREADGVVYTYAGPEIAVATTKGYTSQVGVMYLLALYFGQIRKILSKDHLKSLIHALSELPDQLECILQQKEMIKYMAEQHVGLKDAFFVGRGMDYASCLEASLKLKEISYVHSEAYAAGELKHGTISLIEKGTFVVALATQDHLIGKTISNMIEVRSRGAFVLGVTKVGEKRIEANADDVFYIPETMPCFISLLAAVPMQLFAYYVAVSKGCDVDQPRNLAKSVTVE